MKATTRTSSSAHARRQPQRTCVACRRTGEQASFVRLVRTPEQAVAVDEGRRHAPGRGAYLCRDLACWERGLRGALTGSLRTALTEDIREALRTYAARFATTDDSPPAAGEREGRDQ
ncbi:MAG: YlxR family protein [Dehalococcoidia bacterium]